MVRDPLSDFLVRVANAQAVGKESTLVPYSKFLWEVSKILEQSFYIKKIDRRGKRAKRFIEVTLAYNPEGEGRIDGMRRISKLSRRVYRGAGEIHSIKHGYGAQIISTSKGLMTDKEARKARVGGEVLFEVW
ncbi:MAG: 30S ribosomal protein S8 [Patescibacteria group bacterium]